ncbi:multidrug resistance protein MdtN [Phycisphaerae bacterium RAS1]|nr:multidrug resistance protein MdtN [Phycisphaerae bacterium RAS1]
MRKWVLLLVVVALVAGGWYLARTFWRVTPLWAQPKFGKVTRGDIRVPITAAGLIQANQEIEIKSKASGEVIDVPVREGTFVAEGAVLLVLKKVDEQRTVDRAQAEQDRATALLAQAKVSIESAKAAILGAEADVSRMEAELAMALFERDKVRDLASDGRAGEQDKVNAEQRYNVSAATKRSAEAQLASAQSRMNDSEQVVKLQEAAVRIATKQLEDAQERLRETTIYAKQPAIVTDVTIEKGMLVQSGTGSFTGGTILMRLADVSNKKVIARVDESDFGRILNISPIDALPDLPGLREAVKAGVQTIATRSGTVKLLVDAFPDDEFEGKIDLVEPQGKLNVGSSIIQFDVHVTISDAKGDKLPLGAQAQVEFTVESAINVMRVPSEGVKTLQGQRGVYISVPPEPGSNEQWGKRFVPCRFGVTDGEVTEVVSVQGEHKLEVDQLVYTKLPVVPSNDDD